MEAGEIKRGIELQKEKLFPSSFAKIKSAVVAIPVPMLDERMEQQYWFVPVIVEHKAAAFAIVNLAGKIIVHGQLTPNAPDSKKIDPSFFSKPPLPLLDEIKSKYPHATIRSKTFSFDQSPQRWAWRIELEKGLDRIILFVSPSGWYEKRKMIAGRE